MFRGYGDEEGIEGVHRSHFGMMTVNCGVVTSSAVGLLHGALWAWSYWVSNTYKKNILWIYVNWIMTNTSHNICYEFIKKFKNYKCYIFANQGCELI